MNLSKILGIAVIAALATSEANAAFFGSDNFLAPSRGASRGAAGWLIDPSAVGVGGNGASAAGQAGVMTLAGDLADGETYSARKRHLATGYFQDGYSFTLSQDSVVSIALDDKEAGSLFNGEKLSLSLVDATGKLVAQASEGESVSSSMLLAGDYTFTVSGLPQGVKGVVYAAQLQASAVPIPAAVWLFGSALAMMFGMTRRRKA